METRRLSQEYAKPRALRFLEVWLAIAIVSLCNSAPVRAAEIIVALSLQQSELTVYEEDDDRELGTLEGPIKLYPTFALRTNERYFRGGESNWGWFIETGAGYYYVDEQSVSGGSKDLGTGIEGYYAHIVPTIFYRWKSRALEGLNYKLGLGVGPGWLTADGDIALTRVEGDPVIDIDSSGLGYAAGLFYEMTYDKWVAQLKVYGPDHGVGGYDLQLLEYRLIIGRSFSF